MAGPFTWNDQVWCCQMRAKYLVAIVGHNPTVPDPVDLVDHIVDWGDAETHRPMLIRMPYCPFCGTKTTDESPVRDPR